MNAPSDILLITGLPGSGKTQYTRWLVEAHGWGCVRYDDERERVDPVLAGHDETLLADADHFPDGFAIEYGFPGHDLGRVGRMIDRGYRAWYFDGDHAAAFEGWKLAHPDLDECLWHYQMASLCSVRPEIASLFGDRIIETVFPGPRHLSAEKIHRAIGLA